MSDVPTKVLKDNVDLFSPVVLNFVNMSINSLTFPSVLKLVDVTPVYKKNLRYQESNCRPVLPNLSIIFGNLLYNQIAPYFEKIFLNIKLVFKWVLILKQV